MSHSLNGFVDKTERVTYLEQLLSGKLPTAPAGQHLLPRLMNPAVRGPFLETLLHQPLSAIQEFIESLAESGDERAVVALTPLLHSLEESVVLTTIAALRRLGSPTARSALTERANFDQRISIRRAAAQALNQLGTASAIEETQLPLHGAYLTVVDGAGGQMVLIARRWDEDDVASFHIILDDIQGIQESFGFPMEPSGEFVDTLNDLEDDGLTPVAVPLPEIRSVAAHAYQQTLEQHGRVSVGFVAWQPFLSGDDSRHIPPVELPDMSLRDDFDVFTACHKLLDLDEFGTWYFEPSEISSAIDRLHKLQRQRSKSGYESRLVGLIRQTLSSHITPDRRQLLRRRLERQATLLMRLYDDPIHARRAQAAASGLAETAGVPVSDHPLLQEMLVRSLEDALGRPLIDEEDQTR